MWSCHVIVSHGVLDDCYRHLLVIHFTPGVLREWQVLRTARICKPHPTLSDLYYLILLPAPCSLLLQL